MFIAYRPPNLHNMACLAECICKFSNINYHYIIVSDVYCAGIDWETRADAAPADGIQDALQDFAIMQGFTLAVDAPTRESNRFATI
jgi:hypothetical protein